MSLMPIIAPVESLPVLSFLQGTDDDTNASSYSFVGENLGTAHATREVFCAVNWSGNGSARTISSASIGGISATIHIEQNSGGTNPSGSAIISASVPTGTSGTVALTMSGACFHCGISVYRVIQLKSTTAHDTGSDTNLDINMTINVQKNGIIIGCATTDAAGTAYTTTGLTEDYDEDLETARRRVSGSASKLAAETGRAIDFENTAASITSAGVCASFR